RWERATAASLPTFRGRRRAVAHQAVEMFSDVSRFRRGVGERDGAIERDTRLVIAAKLHQERAAYPEEMEIVGEPRRQRLGHLECGFRALDLRDRDRAVERHHR